MVIMTAEFSAVAFRADQQLTTVNPRSAGLVADALTATRVPFVFATGYGESTVIPERFLGTPVVAKPYDERSLRRALSTGLVDATKSA